MARIESYNLDNNITPLDIVIGTDGDENNNTKNFTMQAIRDFVLAGASPEQGGNLKITCVIQDTPVVGIESPEALINALPTPFAVNAYEIVFVRLAYNDSGDGGKLRTKSYVFHGNNDTFGLGQTQVVADDFFLIEEDFDTTVLDNLVSIGDAGVDIYKGLNGDNHEIRKIKSTTTDLSINGDSVKIERQIGNVGTGVNIFKGFASTVAEFFNLKSSTLNIALNGNDIEIEQPTIDIGGVANFIINNDYTGAEELGTTAKPFKTWAAAKTAYLGTGDFMNPENLSATITFQKTSTPHIITDPNAFTIRALNINLEDNPQINYNAAGTYLYDTREFIGDPSYNPAFQYTLTIAGEGRITCNESAFVYIKGIYANKVLRAINKSKLEVRQIYDTANSITIEDAIGSGVPITDTNGNDISFYQGDPNTLPAMVLDGNVPSSTSWGNTEGDFTLRVTSQTGIICKNGGYYYEQDRGGKTEVRYNSNSFAHYGSYNSGDPVSTPVVFQPNTDFNFIRLENSGRYFGSELNTIISSGIENTVEALIKLDSSANTATGVPNKILEIRDGVWVSVGEAKHPILIDNTTHTVILKDLRIEGSPVNGRYTMEVLGTESISCDISNVIFNNEINNVDLTKGNAIARTNIINNNITNSLRSFNDRAAAISAGLPVGGLFINTNGGDVVTANHFQDIVILP